MPETQCRLSHDAFHVEYIVKDDEEYRSVDTRIVTHIEVRDADDKDEDETEYSWIIDIDGDRAQFSLFLEDGDAEQLLHQFLSETVCFQLADMFQSAAVLLRENRRKEEIAEAKAKAQIQELPFQKL